MKKMEREQSHHQSDQNHLKNTVSVPMVQSECTDGADDPCVSDVARLLVDVEQTGVVEAVARRHSGEALLLLQVLGLQHARVSRSV